MKIIIDEAEWVYDLFLLSLSYSTTYAKRIYYLIFTHYLGFTYELKHPGLSKLQTSIKNYY